MDAWLTVLISGATTLVGVGIVFGMLRARSENNSILIRELREYVMTQVQDVKTTRATVERVDAIVDRFDRFETDLKQNLQEKFDDMRDAIKDLTTRLHQEVSQTNRRIDE